MTDRTKNILIGFFVTAAFAIAVAMIFFLKPTIGDGKQTLKVRFANISGINKGTRVTYAGRPIGLVAKIDEIPNAREEATDHLGRVYYYQLLLRIDSKINVYTSDDVSVCTTGLMGERSIAIIPKAPSDGQKPEKIQDQIILANSVDALESTFNHIGRVAAKAEKTIDHFNTWFDQNADKLAEAAVHVGQASASIHQTLSVAESQNLVPAIKESVDLASDNMRFIRSAFNDDQLLTRLANLLQELKETAIIFNTDGAKTIANLSRLTTDLASGTGTLGQILTGDNFYLRINSLISKSEILMNDINHYGLLFQYNKQWQKQRTKKANLARSLESPKEFRAYFESEIDEIGASLGRIAEMLDRADQEKDRNAIMQNIGFQKDFAVLLRQVKALNDSIRLLNQDLVNKSEEGSTILR